MKYVLEDLLANDGFTDECGKAHTSGLKGVRMGSGTIRELPELIAELGCKKPFLLADGNTWKAAGERVAATLDAAGIAYEKHVMGSEHIPPDEYAVGSAVMHFDRSCDILIGIGSGVINDTGKILAATADIEYIIVATAPSMDGYASSSSSMERDGFKLSLPSRGASYVVGDTDVLCEAPALMIAAGVGDIVAKYVSIVEWRMSALINNEYYCPVIADMVLESLDEVVKNAEGLANREPKAVEAVMRAMVLAGISMNYAGLSRPASGVEHYFSHVWDMRGLEFGAKTSFHGVQCAIGTLLAIKVYEQLKLIKPDREKALAHARSFDKAAWFDELRAFLGRGAEAMIAAEDKDRKYDPETHAVRLENIISHWDELVAEMNKLPDYDWLKNLLEKVGSPTTPDALGYTPAEVKKSFAASKDIRFKYIASHLVWDLGVDVDL